MGLLVPRLTAEYAKITYFCIMPAGTVLILIVDYRMIQF